MQRTKDDKELTTATAQRDAVRLRILVVEDHSLVAETIAMALEDSGHDVVGPAPDLRRGLELAASQPIDGALLDVNLAGESSFPIAAVLRQRGIPFLFLTGYVDMAAIPGEFRSAERLTKPFRIAELSTIATRAFRRG